jgi:hypothetical protein
MGENEKAMHDALAPVRQMLSGSPHYETDAQKTAAAGGLLVEVCVQLARMNDYLATLEIHQQGIYDEIAAWRRNG